MVRVTEINPPDAYKSLEPLLTSLNGIVNGE
jgi:hypothetical protein